MYINSLCVASETGYVIGVTCIYISIPPPPIKNVTKDLICLKL